MSTPTTQFDYQAQPYWDEDGTYFPPGFDPQSGSWLDQAYEDAYAQGFVWDASIQDWVPFELPPEQIESHSQGFLPDMAIVPVEPPPLDDPEREQVIFDAVHHALRESPEAADLQTADKGSERLYALAKATATATKSLLDAIARDSDETTFLSNLDDTSTRRLILSLLQEIAPKPDPAPIELPPEITPPFVPALTSPFMTAPEPRLLVGLEELTNSVMPLSEDLWRFLELGDRPQIDAAESLLAEPPTTAASLPFDITETSVTEQIAQTGHEVRLELKNGMPLPAGFDDEIDPSPHPRADLNLMDENRLSDRAAFLQKLDRALEILAQAEPEQLENSIYFPLDTPPEKGFFLETLWSPSASNDRHVHDGSPSHQNQKGKPRRGDKKGPAPSVEVAGDDIELALTALADSVGQQPQPLSPTMAEPNGLPMVRLKRSDKSTPYDGDRPTFSSSGMTSPTTIRTKGSLPNKEAIEVATLIDLPSDDIELALTTLANFIRRQSASTQAADATSSPPSKPSSPPIRRAPPPPLPTQKAFSSKKPSMPSSPPQSIKKLSQKPIPDIKSTPPKPLRSIAPTPSNVPVAIALNGTFRVLCRTLEGTVHRGVLRHPNLTAPSLTLELHPGPTFMALETKTLQAIFFLRRPDQESSKPEGRKARLLFKSGRQRSGRIPAFDPNGSGFFFYPNETQDSPTDFWFVYAAGLASIDLE